jgi:transcriptional regulator with XRE-family HTH domain
MKTKQDGVKFSEVVGAVVRMHRTLRKVSLSEFAVAMGSGTSGWSRTETGDTTMSIDQLHRAASALECPAWMLIKEAEEALATSTTARPRRRRSGA